MLPQRFQYKCTNPHHHNINGHYKSTNLKNSIKYICVYFHYLNAWFESCVLPWKCKREAWLCLEVHNDNDCHLNVLLPYNITMLRIQNHLSHPLIQYYPAILLFEWKSLQIDQKTIHYVWSYQNNWIPLSTTKLPWNWVVFGIST